MWQPTENGLHKQFTFTDFNQAFAFMTRVAALAENRKHHPRWENEWNVVQIWLLSHDAGNQITDKDYEMAAAIDELVASVMSALPHRVKLYSDGGSRGNPGPSASGYVILDGEDHVLIDEGRYVGVTTNNQAEYLALKYGLQAAYKLGAKEVDCYLDSSLVVNQMNGVYNIKNRDLWPVHDAIKDLADQFEAVHYTHVPREHNQLADAVVNRELDKQAAAGGSN